ncbi:MAG: hypothetical protein ACLUB3_05010 [Clostridium sp.]
MEKFEKEGETLSSESASGRNRTALTARQRRKAILECTFDADGIAKGADWINERYEAELPRWKKVSRL